MKPGKRILKILVSIVLALSMLFSGMPFSAVNAQADDTVSRADWIGELVSTFGMTIEDDSDMPDNYYSDLTSDMDCYKNIMIAVEFGVIDIEPGEKFEPNSAATREFAVHSLNLCLGLQLEGDGSYTYSDTADVTYQDDAQIAVNREWISLSDGKFLPNQAITTTERSAMLENAKSIIETDEADVAAEDWTFADGVKVLSGVSASIDSNGIVTINGEIDLAEDDIFAVYIDNFPIVKKAVSVSVADGVTTIKTSDDGTEDAITGGAGSGTINFDLEDFVAADDATYSVTNTEDSESTTEELSIQTAGMSYDTGTKTLTITKSVKLGGSTEGSFSYKLSDMKIDYSANGKNEYCSVVISGTLEESMSLNFDLADYAGIPSEIPLGEVSYWGIASIDVGVEISAAGGLTGSWSGPLEAGFTYNKGDLRIIKSFKKESFTITAEASLSAGLYARAQVGIAVIANAEVKASTGATIGFKSTTYTDGNMPKRCDDEVAYLYANVSVSAKFWKVKIGETCEIYGKTNSPIKVHYHWEDGVKVTSCTRGLSDEDDYSKYFTSSTSSYIGIGPSYSGSSSGTGSDTSVWTYELDDDSNATITGYSGTSRAVAVPKTLDGYTVVAIGDNVFCGNEYNYNTTLRTVTFPSTVTSIGDCAFKYCTNLSSVTLPNNLKTLGSYAFGYCTSLKKIEIPASLESGDGSFVCSGLVEATFEEGATEVVFGLFDSAENLKDVTLVDTITTIKNHAFRNCIALESINIPDSVTSIEGGYYQGGAFRGCTALTDVSLSKNITEIGICTFYGCTNLSNVQLPEKLETLGGDAFGNCTALTEINIPKSLTKISTDSTWYNYYPFSGSGLIKATFEEGTTKVVGNLFGCAYSLEDVTLLDTMTTIENKAFINCTSLNSIEIPDSVTSLGSSAFYKCTKLSSVTLPSTLTTINASTFCGCTSLTEITLPSDLTEIGDDAFNSSGLTKITIPEKCATIGANALQSCTALTEVVLESGVQKIESCCLDGCTSLSSVTIPDTVTSIGTYAFRNCDALTEITIPQSVTSIEKTAFSYPKKLTIYGVNGSYAETFASTVGCTFVAIDKPATAITLSQTELSLAKGDTYTLALSVKPSDFTDTVTWKSTDASVATITDAGLVTAAGVGTATIKVVVGNLSASCNVTVYQPVTSLSLNKTSLSLEALETCQLTATVKPTTAANTTVTWSSSDSTIASVDVNGLVTAYKKGEATITATSNSNASVSKSCTVTVPNNAYVADSYESLESDHDYGNSCSDVWMIVVDDAESISLTFDSRTYIEDGFDYLYIYDANRNEIGKYTGTALAGQTVKVTGNTVKLKLVTDSAGTAWGFKVSAMKTSASSGGSGDSGDSGSSGDSGTETAVSYNSMYRLYNPNSGEHFYTASSAEKNNLVAAGWDYEGVAWNAPKSSNTPVYRMYNPNPSPKTGSGEHHYTTSTEERDMLVKAGWIYEGIGWYSDDAKSVPLYRLYNPNEYNNNHHYTSSTAERDYLLSLGWRDEGIAWHGVN